MYDKSSINGCGIVGVASLKATQVRSIRESDFSRMLDSLKHRGPDCSKMWSHKNIMLGHTRLSILDLSDKGTQPMICDNMVITYNGEVYNFKDIKYKLEKLGISFFTGTDTEVILRAYQQWGSKCLEELNGMFAFCIYDLSNNTFFLARDHIGIKPLYYYIDSNYFLFSSEVESLLKSGYIPKEVNRGLLYQQLIFSSSLQYSIEQTLIKNVYSLLPGHYLTLDLNKGVYAICKYWDLPNGETNSNSRKHQVDKLKFLLEKSVRYRLTSDVPVASFLSGGLDSSLITAIACKELEPQKLQCFTLSYEDQSLNSEYEEDLKYSKSFVSSFEKNIDFNEVKIPFASFNLDQLDGVIDFANLSEDPRLIAVRNNYEAVNKSKIKVILNGQGADELMGGYIQVNPLLLNVVNEDYSFESVKKWFLQLSTPNLTIFNEQVLGIQLETCNELWKFFDSFQGTALRKAHCFLTKVALHRILKFEDLLSMKFGVECRVPFLDHEIINWAFSIPFEQHIDVEKRIGKLYLKEVAQEYLPREIINRPKNPFPKPNYEQIYKDLKKCFKNLLPQIMKDELVRDIYKKEIYDSNNLSFYELWTVMLIFRWNYKLNSL